MAVIRGIAVVKAGVVACQRELDQMAHVHDHLAWELDRRDFLNELAEGYHAALRAGTVPGEFLILIATSWRRPLAEYRYRLLSWLGQLVANLHEALRQLDQVAKVSSALLAQFNSVLDALAQETPDPLAERGEASAATRLQIDGFVFTHPWTGYATFRDAALDFCLQECIWPEELANAIAGYDQFLLSPEEHLASRIAADWPLRALCRAYFLFWA